MHQLKGWNGIAYSCSNSDNQYCDDWYTSKYENIFNNETNSRSLYKVKELSFNAIRTYYLDPNLDHSTFLNTCDRLNISLEIGISNNLLENRDIEQIQKLINQVKNYKCVVLYTIGNEYFGDIKNIIFALTIIYSIDPNKYYMHSSIFDQSFKSAIQVYEQIPEYILSKYIVGINMYFLDKPCSLQGDIMQNVIKEFYNNSILENAYLIISEYGWNEDFYQCFAIWNFTWGNMEALKNYPKYLGYTLFSFSNENWKGCTNNENNYGILTETGEPKRGWGAVKEILKTNEFRDLIPENLFNHNKLPNLISKTPWGTEIQIGNSYKPYRDKDIKIKLNDLKKILFQNK